MIGFAIGSCLGSFFCLAVQRGYQQQSLLAPGSHCSHCQTPLKYYEMLPIISVLLLRFRCRYCQAPLPAAYLFGELACGFLGSWLASQPCSPLTGFQLLWLGSSLLLSLIDLFFLFVEARLLYPVSALLLGWALVLQLPLYWQNPLLLAGLFWLLDRMLPDSFGGGDVQLLLCWSLFFTFQQMMLLLVLASLSGIAAFVITQQRQTEHLKMPFVPFLWSALFIVLNWPQPFRG